MPFTNNKNRLIRLLPDWLIGAFCLAIPALYNSFPLVTPDSGAYIGNAYTLYIPIDRPLLYSIFVRITSLGISLWGVVLAQVLILSVLMQFIAERVLGASYSRARFSGIMLLMGVATSAGWFAGQLMPDIFTAVLLLCILALLHQPQKTWQRWTLYLTIFTCILVHNSNLLISLICGVPLLIIAIRKKEQLLKLISVTLILTAALGWLSLSAMNAIAGRKFSPSSASHVFLMSRMVENGMMDEFLDEYCPTDSSSYKLCAYRGKLPNRQWDFMWGEQSALYETGGWNANREEYNRIIRKTLFTPKYLLLHVTKSAHATMRQLPLIYVGDGLQQMGSGENLQKEIHNHFKNEEKDYLSSAQMNGGLNFSVMNLLIAGFSLMISSTALLINRKKNEQDPVTMQRLIFVSILFLLVNAFVTATFATVIGRYEARVFWILPFLAILQLIRCLDGKGMSCRSLSGVEAPRDASTPLSDRWK